MKCLLPLLCSLLLIAGGCRTAPPAPGVAAGEGAVPANSLLTEADKSSGRGRLGLATADGYACVAERLSSVADSPVVAILTFPIAYVLYLLGPGPKA